MINSSSIPLQPTRVGQAPTSSSSLLARLGALITRAALAAADRPADESAWTSIARGF